MTNIAASSKKSNRIIDDLDYLDKVLMPSWASWKLCRPVWDRENEERTPESRPELASKPPANVWMTPRYEVVKFQAIDDAYNALNPKIDGERLMIGVIKGKYLEGLHNAKIAALIKKSRSGIPYVLDGALRYISEWLRKNG